jgi:hypothetical protein
MSDRELPSPRGRASLPGYLFQHGQVADGARARLKDTYNISWFLMDKYHERLTRYRSREPAHTTCNEYAGACCPAEARGP